MNVKIFLFLTVLLFACGRPPTSPNPESRSQKPVVLVSIAPYQFLVEKIGQDVCDVQTIIPPRFNPHAFEPTAKQVSELSKGQIWFRIGEPFEEKILPLLSPALRIADLRDGIELQPLDEETHCEHCSADHLDRHIWLSPKKMGEQAVKIGAVLSERFPNETSKIEENLASLLHQIETLDLEIRSLLTPLKDRSFIVSHSAFGYFCQEYQLEQLSVEQEGKDPRPRHLEALLEKAQRSHPTLALALPQHNNKGAQLVAKKMQIPIRMIDPYSANYFDMMRHLAQIIADPQSETAP